MYVYRYDGRGALGDLRIYEPPTGGFDHRTILTEDELKVEQLCDEERYRSLYNNEMEDAVHHGKWIAYMIHSYLLLVHEINNKIYMVVFQRKK